MRVAVLDIHKGESLLIFMWVRKKINHCFIIFGGRRRKGKAEHHQDMVLLPFAFKPASTMSGLFETCLMQKKQKKKEH